MDGVGNWAGFDEDTDGDGTNELEQTRNVNTANEIANLAGGGWVGPTYDAAGNMISSPRPGGETGRLFFTYDGWNRLTKVHVDTDADALFEPTTGDALVADYEYDGRNRRIEKSVTADGGGARDVDYFYNENWQLLESQTVTGTVTSIDQTIWDISYIDAPAVHYHDANGDGDHLDPGDTIQYPTWDANQNITATITADGTITTRYIYTPYGEATATTATWTNPTTPTTDTPLYAGYHHDTETALHHVRNRTYHPTLGKFTTRDPIGYEGEDVNLYRYVGNGPTHGSDPEGLREFTLAFVYQFGRTQLTPGIKKEVARIFQDAVKRFAHKDHTLVITWTAKPEKAEYEKQCFGVTWNRFTRSGARVGIRENPNSPYVGQGGGFEGSFNPNRVRDAALDANVTMDIAIATTIAHEIGLHGIADTAWFGLAGMVRVLNKGHIHEEGYVDALRGQMGKVFSDEAAKQIISVLDMEDGDGYWDPRK